jgi:hypothetical protein
MPTAKGTTENLIMLHGRRKVVRLVAGLRRNLSLREIAGPMKLSRERIRQISDQLGTRTHRYQVMVDVDGLCGSCPVCKKPMLWDRVTCEGCGWTDPAGTDDKPAE